MPAIDPVYFETTYYLGPDKAGEKAYALLVTAMKDAGLAAVVQFVWREKENIAAIRAVDGTLILHTLFFADEVRTLHDITAGRQKVDASQVRLARKLVEELRTERFDPNKYKDAYRARLQAAARQKAKGKSLVLDAPTKTKEPVVDLMEALQASLGRKAQERKGRRRTRTQTSLGGRSRRRQAA